MKGKVRLALLSLFLVASIAILPRVPVVAEPSVSEPPAKSDAAGGRNQKERKIKYWVAPMDPTYIRDQPGKSPMGMDLVPVYEDEGGDGSTITVDPVVVQNMGVRIKPVERGAIHRLIRTVGTVDVAEDRLSVVSLRFSGWIERLHADQTGVLIAAGAPLFDVYSPELLSAQEEYLLALRTAGKDSSLAASTRRRLELWELSGAQIDAIAKAGKPLTTITIRSPRTGHVLRKNVVEGANVMAGMELYRIGNLDTVWINADIYEFDAPWVRLGQQATVELTFQQGTTYDGTVAYIYPTLNEKTRTLEVRLALPNPDLAIKPGMFATVQIAAQHRNDVLLVPTEAILHSGVRQIVFVALGGGKYEKRELRTGVVGDRYVTEVLEGLKAGERVVVSGQFLLDSESQLQEAVQKLLDSRLESKQAAPMVMAGSEAQHDHGEEGEVYWTCGMHPQIVQDHPGTCPICGMDLVERRR